MESALDYYGYIKRTPSAWQIAVSDKTRRDRFKIVYPSIKPHFVKQDKYSIGIVKGEVAGIKIKVYDRERTICDCLFHKNKMDSEVFNDAIKNYLNDPNKNVARLGEYANVLHVEKKVRDKINSGKIIGPRILASNTAISVPGGHMAGSVAKACESIDEAVSYIDELKKENVDLIKLMITGGVMDAKEKGVPGQLKMASEMVRACTDKAHEFGYIVSAHVESQEGVKVALENGVDSIEHGAVLDDECIRLFKEKKAFLVCTISPGIPYALFDREVAHTSEVEKYNGELVLNGFIEGVKSALENNIPVALGNDVGCPWISQYDFYRELVYFHKYVGVSNSFALYSATLNNANLAGIGDITGSIERGKFADMIVTCKNPLDDLNNLRKVDMVISRGKVFNKPSVKRNAYVDSYLDEYMK